MFRCCFYCLISFLQLAAFCQQFIKEMCYVMLCSLAGFVNTWHDQSHSVASWRCLTTLSISCLRMSENCSYRPKYYLQELYKSNTKLSGSQTTPKSKWDIGWKLKKKICKSKNEKQQGTTAVKTGKYGILMPLAANAYYSQCTRSVCISLSASFVWMIFCPCDNENRPWWVDLCCQPSRSYYEPPPWEFLPPSLPSPAD